MEVIILVCHKACAATVTCLNRRYKNTTQMEIKYSYVVVRINKKNLKSTRKKNSLSKR